MSKLNAEVICQSCCTCKQSLLLIAFGKSKNATNGHARVCKACRKAEYQSNPIPAKQRASIWKKENPKKRLENNRIWREQNPEKTKASRNKWAHNNKAYGAFNRSVDRTKRKQAMPLWANEFFIEEAYHLAKLRTELFGFKWHVDHIIPIKGKTVCGLHVENNLQVIPAIDNLKKGNKCLHF